MDNRLVSTDPQGGKIEFEELKFREYLIAFANYGEFPVENVVLPSPARTGGKDSGKGTAIPAPTESVKQDAIIGNVVVPPAEAEQLLDRIAVLAVCKLVQPYVSSDTEQQTPTPEVRRDYLAQYHYLNVRLMELWFYNFDTGKVLLKLIAAQNR